MMLYSWNKFYVIGSRSNCVHLVLCSVADWIWRDDQWLLGSVWLIIGLSIIQYIIDSRKTFIIGKEMALSSHRINVNDIEWRDSYIARWYMDSWHKFVFVQIENYNLLSALGFGLLTVNNLISSVITNSTSSHQIFFIFHIFYW